MTIRSSASGASGASVRSAGGCWWRRLIISDSALCAPDTRPGRYTILERLGLTEVQVAARVEAYAQSFAG